VCKMRTKNTELTENNCSIERLAWPYCIIQDEVKTKAHFYSVVS